MRKSKALLSLSTASLLMLPSACVTVRSSCPPLVTYSKAFQQQAADELDALKTGSRVGTMIVDYGKLRDACKVGRT